MCPSLFLSHGAPTLALDGGSTGEAFSAMGLELRASLDEIRAVVVMSPHWITPTLSVSVGEDRPILHDFHGFPESLYRLDYPAPGSKSQAVRLKTVLEDAGYEDVSLTARALDHGAWVPLRFLFEKADIPVIQISMPYPKDPSWYFRVGEVLRPLVDSGMLLIGSGGMTHNLGDYRGQSRNIEPFPYVGPFAEWFFDHLSHWDLEALFDYRRRAPEAERAHPSDDHLMPLFFALGASPHGVARRFHQDVTHGILAMDSYQFGT